MNHATLAPIGAVLENLLVEADSGNHSLFHRQTPQAGAALNLEIEAILAYWCAA
jgi:hypothetical protein